MQTILSDERFLHPWLIDFKGLGIRKIHLICYFIYSYQLLLTARPVCKSELITSWLIAHFSFIHFSFHTFNT